MGTTVSIDGLADAVMHELREHNKYAAESLREIANEVAREGAKKLRSSSPVGTSKKHYQSGWTVKAENAGAGKFSFVVYNRLKPGLAHLLENGHQLRQGGRSPAIVHIKPVEEWCNREYEKRAKERLRK